MKKQSVGTVLLVLSLLANVLLGYAYFGRESNEDETTLPYAQSIDLLKRAESILAPDQGAANMQQTGIAFNAFQMVHQAQLAMKDYEKSYIEKGVRVQYLQTMLNEVATSLMEETSHGINGKPVASDRLLMVDKKLKDILRTLPSEETDVDTLQSAFQKLQTQRE